MNILFVVSGFLPAESHGGVPFSAYNLVKELIGLGNSVKVFTTDRNGSQRLNVPSDCWIAYENIEVFYAKTCHTPYVFIKNSILELNKAISEADVVLDSSTLWNHLGWLVDKFSIKYGVKHVLYLRGLLDPWAVSHKPLRKKILLALQGRRILDNCDAIVALSKNEAIDIEEYVNKSKIFVIPNGAPKIVSIKENTQVTGVPRDVNVADGKYILFLGRINEKKGLDQTVKAFKIHAKRVNGTSLIIAGPLDGNYYEKLVKIIGSDERIILLPPKYGNEKDFLIKSAAAVILTSKSEGMPMVILEAMGAGVPAIVTPNCNLDEVSNSDAGWEVRLEDIEQTAAAIDEAFISDVRSRKSANAHDLVSKCFGWDKIASRTIELIRSL